MISYDWREEKASRTMRRDGKHKVCSAAGEAAAIRAADKNTASREFPTSSVAGDSARDCRGRRLV